MSIKFMWINEYEPAADEKKLEEFAAKGEFFKYNLWFLSFFKKGTPKNVRYSIEPAVFKPNKKKRSAYEECGWKYEGSGDSFNMYMSEDENAVPLHTDRSEFAHIVKKKHFATAIILILLYLIVALDVLLPIIFFPITTFGEVRPILFTLPLMYGLQTTFLATSIFIPFIIFPGLLIYVNNFIKAGKFVTGCIENKIDADKAIRRNNFMTGIFIFLLVVNVAIICFYAYASLDNDYYDVSFSDLPESIVTIDEIYTENIEFILTDEAAEKYIDPELWNKIHAYPPRASNTTSVFTDCHYDYWQYAAYIPDGKEKGQRISIHCTYTEFKNNWLAKQGADEFINYEYFFFHFEEKTDIVSFDTSGTPFLKGEYFVDGNNLYIVLVNENAVQTISMAIPSESGLTPEMIFENISNNIR